MILLLVKVVEALFKIEIFVGRKNFFNSFKIYGFVFQVFFSEAIRF